MNLQNQVTTIRNLIEKHWEEIVCFRKDLHRNPELSFKEEKTSEAIFEKINSMGSFKIEKGFAKHGMTALLKSHRDDSQDKKTIALRADMDALPILEKTELPYSSQNPGVHHACGHDGHMANLFGAMKVLSEMKPELKNDIKFIFQPAEEQGGGANIMCQEGVLENPKVDAIYGLHGKTGLPLGKIVARPGPMMGNSTNLDFKIIGKGGHAALPHLAVDPILIGARVIESLQSVVSRENTHENPVVLSITKFQGGTTNNVIPEEVYLSGTMRTVDDKLQDHLIERVSKMVHSICEAHGGKVEISISKSYPVTYNHHESLQEMMKLLSQVFTEEELGPLDYPLMGVEDFSYYLQKVPGVFFFLGLGEEDEKGVPLACLHDPKFDFQDTAMKNGILAMCLLALHT